MVELDIDPEDPRTEAVGWVATLADGELAPPRVLQFPESALMLMMLPAALPVTPPPRPKLCADAGGDELEERISSGENRSLKSVPLSPS